MSIDEIKAELDNRLVAMAHERDKLRDLELECAFYCDKPDEAYDAILEAIDRLSEVV